MPLSQCCRNCGVDLARIRPRTDPHYGLRLITCPACQCCDVRDRRPVTRAIDRMIRTTASIRGLLLQVAALAFFLPVLIATRERLTYILPEGPPDLPPRETALFLAFCSLLTMGYGAWLTMAMGHLGRWRALLIGSGSLLILSLFMLPWTQQALEVLISNLEKRRPTPAEFPRPQRTTFTVPALAAFAQCVVIFGGVPLGIGGLAIGRILRRSRWRMRRRWRRRMRL